MYANFGKSYVWENFAAGLDRECLAARGSVDWGPHVATPLTFKKITSKRQPPGKKQVGLTPTPKLLVRTKESASHNWVLKGPTCDATCN